MRIRSMFSLSLKLLIISALFFGCATTTTSMPPKATEANFTTPKVTLSHVEVEHYWGWYYYSKKVEPTKGKAGDYGAPLDLAFIFEVENPNSFPVKMESMKFTVALEEFDLNTVGTTEAMWIPAGKTNEIRIHCMLDGRSALLSLMVTGGFKLKEKGMSPFDQLAYWWENIPEFSFPIHAKEGAAIFSADGITKSTSFNMTFP